MSTEKDITEKLRDDDYDTKLPFGELKSPERKAYYQDMWRLEQEFKKDAFAELDISHNPKREKLYSIAYRMGHSSGYNEIWCHMCDMVDLIKD